MKHLGGVFYTMKTSFPSTSLDNQMINPKHTGQSTFTFDETWKSPDHT